eukprot:11280670-Prorocentrum_lima.AAC.1
MWLQETCSDGSFASRTCRFLAGSVRPQISFMFVTLLAATRTRLSPGEAGNEATHGGRLSESGVAECPTSFFACSACSRFPAYHT